jgi:hypothetical protein
MPVTQKDSETAPRISFADRRVTRSSGTLPPLALEQTMDERFGPVDS